MNDRERRGRRPKIGISEEEGEGAFANRQRLRENLLGTYAEVKLPRKIRTLLKDTELTQSELFFKVWWVAPNPLFGNYSPQQMWELGAKDLVIDHLFAPAGDQYELLDKVIKRIAKAR